MIDHFRATGFATNLVYIVGAGLALRGLWAILIPVIPISDANVYWVAANNIAEYGVYGLEPNEPFSYWAVGTSAIYAPFLWVFGPTVNAVILVNLIAGGALVWSTGLLGRRWINERTGLLAASIIALWPTLIFYTTIVASEVLFAAAINLGLLLWGGKKGSSGRWGFVSGIAFGIAALIRPTGALVLVIIGALDALRSRSIVSVISPTILAVLSFGLVVTPWSVRNTELHGEFVFISTNGGPNLWMGNNPESNGGYEPLPDWTQGMSEIERAQILGERATTFMLDDPLRTTVLFFRKLIDTHATETIGVVWNTDGIKERFDERAILPLKALTQAYWTLVLASALAGALIVCASAWRANSLLDQLTVLASPPLVLWAYFAFVHAIVVSQDRYHLQSAAFIAMLSAGAVVSLSDRVKNRRASQDLSTESPAK